MQHVYFRPLQRERLVLAYPGEQQQRNQCLEDWGCALLDGVEEAMLLLGQERLPYILPLFKLPSLRP